MSKSPSPGLLDFLRGVIAGLQLARGSYIVLFGSVAEGRFSGLSDIDLAVRGLSDRDALIVAKLVESQTGRSVDIVFIERASLPLLYEALAAGVFLAGDYDAFIEDKWRALMLLLDYAEAYWRMHNAYFERVISHGLRRVAGNEAWSKPENR